MKVSLKTDVGGLKNFSRVDIGGLSIYFSYETPIAFDDGRILVVSENVWSNTTGKHLNYLRPNNDNRTKRDEFIALLDKAIEEVSK